MFTQFIREFKLKYCWLWIWGKKARREYRYKFYNYNHFGTRVIYDQNDSNKIIETFLQMGGGNCPCLITRFGLTELSTLRYYLENIQKVNLQFPNRYKKSMKILSGFFSNDDYNLIRFCSETLEIAKNIDAIGIMGARNEYEKNVIEKYAPNAKLLNAGVLGNEIWKIETPWTRLLKGKKVLVIHPFEKTILHQYQKREKLFKNPLTLPEFELKTLKAVQGLGGNSETKQYKNWFEALDTMCEKINKIDFDIALIGAGAYGMFLANHVKKIGKQAIHIGGATQLLFGIKGARWNSPTGEAFMNEEWIYPLKEDTPNADSLREFVYGEGGNCAYWKDADVK